MPTLLEMQTAVRSSLLGGDTAANLRSYLSAPDRLSIYRNTHIGSLTAALRLSYPAVHKLVGEDFFDGAAARFIRTHPPHQAYLYEYGGAFPEFLLVLPEAKSLSYLSDVARLEWAVNRALHAPSAPPLDNTRLAKITARDQARLAFTVHPAVSLVHSAYPVDTIWQAVLGSDDQELAAVDLYAGPVCLLIDRENGEVRVRRIDETHARFSADLFAGLPLQASLDMAHGDATSYLADHLTSGHFSDFQIVGDEAPIEELL